MNVAIPRLLLIWRRVPFGERKRFRAVSVGFQLLGLILRFFNIVAVDLRGSFRGIGGSFPLADRVAVDDGFLRAFVKRSRFEKDR